MLLAGAEGRRAGEKRYLGKQAVIAESTLPTFTFLAYFDLLIIIVNAKNARSGPLDEAVCMSHPHLVSSPYSNDCERVPRRHRLYNDATFEATAGKIPRHK